MMLTEGKNRDIHIHQITTTFLFELIFIIVVDGGIWVSILMNVTIR